MQLAARAPRACRRSTVVVTVGRRRSNHTITPSAPGHVVYDPSRIGKLRQIKRENIPDVVPLPPKLPPVTPVTIQEAFNTAQGEVELRHAMQRLASRHFKRQIKQLEASVDRRMALAELDDALDQFYWQLIHAEGHTVLDEGADELAGYGGPYAGIDMDRVKSALRLVAPEARSAIRESLRSQLESIGATPAFLGTYFQHHDALKANSTGIIPSSALEEIPPIMYSESLARYACNEEQQTHVLSTVALVKMNITHSDPPVSEALQYVKCREWSQEIQGLRKQGYNIRLLVVASPDREQQTLSVLRRVGGIPATCIVTHSTPALDPRSGAIRSDVPLKSPGSGDVFATLLSKGYLHALMEEGVQYVYMSEWLSTAPLDSWTAGYVYTHKPSVLLEVCTREERHVAAETGAGTGHLCNVRGQWSVRSVHQSDPGDEYDDVVKHPWSVANALWVSLKDLHAIFAEKGCLPLPMVKREEGGVVWLQTLCTSIVSMFPTAGVVGVPSSRHPVDPSETSPRNA